MPREQRTQFAHPTLDKPPRRTWHPCELVHAAPDPSHATARNLPPQRIGHALRRPTGKRRRRRTNPLDQLGHTYRPTRIRERRQQEMPQTAAPQLPIRRKRVRRRPTHGLHSPTGV